MNSGGAHGDEQAHAGDDDDDHHHQDHPGLGPGIGCGTVADLHPHVIGDGRLPLDALLGILAERVFAYRDANGLTASQPFPFGPGPERCRRGVRTGGHIGHGFNYCFPGRQRRLTGLRPWLGAWVTILLVLCLGPLVLIIPILLIPLIFIIFIVPILFILTVTFIPIFLIFIPLVPVILSVILFNLLFTLIFPIFLIIIPFILASLYCRLLLLLQSILFILNHLFFFFFFLTTIGHCRL